MSDSTTDPTAAVLPAPLSRGRLLATLAISLAVAGLLLVTTVLPAEYGIDPTGVGGLLGLDRLGSPAGVAPPPPMADSSGGRVLDQPIKSETIEIPIGPGEEVEHKVGMVEGSSVLFQWTSTGSLYSDFHAHPYNDLDGSEIRYRETDGVSAESGAITAPYSGFHGWYWRNDGDQPVTVTLEVTGFFTHTKELHRALASAAL
jgi:hypothetical protein